MLNYFYVSLQIFLIQFCVLQQVIPHVIVAPGCCFAIRNRTFSPDLLVNNFDVLTKPLDLEVRFAAVGMFTFEVSNARMLFHVRLQHFIARIFLVAAGELAFELSLRVDVQHVTPVGE